MCVYVGYSGVVQGAKVLFCGVCEFLPVGSFVVYVCPIVWLSVNGGVGGDDYG